METDEQILSVFCGRESTDTEQAPGQQVTVSPGNFLSLTFRSDFSNEERYTGFDAHYSAVGKLVLCQQCATYLKFLHSKSRISINEGLFIDKMSVHTSILGNG